MNVMESIQLILCYIPQNIFSPCKLFETFLDYKSINIIMQQKNRVDQNQTSTCMSSQASNRNRWLLSSVESQRKPYCSNSFCPCKAKGRDELLSSQIATSVIINPYPLNAYTMETTQSECSDQFESLDSVNMSSRQIDINQQTMVVQDEYQIKTTMLPENQDSNSQSSNEVKNPETGHEHQTVIFLDNSFKKDNGKLYFMKNKMGILKRNVTEYEQSLYQLKKDFQQIKLKFKADYEKLKEVLSRYLQAQKMQLLKMQSTAFLQKQEFDKTLKYEISRETNKYFQKQIKMQLQIDILLQQILRVKKVGEQSILAQRDKIKIVNRDLQLLKQRLMRNELQNDVLRKLIKEKEREENNKNQTIKKLQCHIQQLMAQKQSPNKNQKLLAIFSERKHNNSGRTAIIRKQSQPQRQQIIQKQKNNDKTLNSHQLKQILRTFEVQVDKDQFSSKINPNIKVASSKERRALTQDNSRRNSNNLHVPMHKFYEITVGNTKNKFDDSNIFKERLKVINQFKNIEKIKLIAQMQTPIMKDTSRVQYYLKKLEKNSKIVQINEQIIKCKSQVNPTLSFVNK